MTVDPKQIAKMITEDPDGVNPLDNIRDEYEEELGFCDGCLRDIDYDSLTACEKCGYWWCETCEVRRSGFDYGRRGDPDAYMTSCPLCNHEHI